MDAAYWVRLAWTAKGERNDEEKESMMEKARSQIARQEDQKVW